MPRYADISDSEPIMPIGFTPGALDKVDADSMAELRLLGEPTPTGAMWKAAPEWGTVAVGDCCWLRSAKSVKDVHEESQDGFKNL